MYPDRELIRLAAHKAALRRDIARRRTQCVAAAARLARPIAWVDRMLAFWRRLSPLTQVAALPLGLLVTRAVFPHRKLLGSFLRWSPLVFGAAKAIRTALKDRLTPAQSANGRH